MSVAFENIYGLFLYTIKIVALSNINKLAPPSQINLLFLVPSVIYGLILKI